jgi:flagellar motor switch protein FliN/FliY
MVLNTGENTEKPPMENPNQTPLSDIQDLKNILQGEEQSNTQTHQSFPPLEEQQEEENAEDILMALLSVPLEVTVEVGSKKITLEELFALRPSSVIVLDKPLSEPVDIKVNGKKIAKGELVVVNNRFGVKITRIISPEERLKKLKN